MVSDASTKVMYNRLSISHVPVCFASLAYLRMYVGNVRVTVSPTAKSQHFLTLEGSSVLPLCVLRVCQKWLFLLSDCMSHSIGHSSNIDCALVPEAFK